jgi:hypothetical protein
MKKLSAVEVIKHTSCRNDCAGVIENVVPLNRVLFVERTRNVDRNIHRSVPKMLRVCSVLNTKKLLDAPDTITFRVVPLVQQGVRPLLDRF